jgi:hypothetical protein
MIDADHLLVILFLLPGFLAARMFALVAVQRKKSHLEMISEVVLFEFLVLAAYAWMPARWQWEGSVSSGEAILGVSALDTLRRNAPPLTALALIAISLGGILGWLHNLDQPLSLLRSLGATKQSSHPTVWQSAFYDRPRWVLVHLESGERILGWPELFSDTPDEGAIFLADAAYLDDEGGLTEIRGPGILIAREAGIRLVEFLDDQRVLQPGWDHERERERS